MDAKAFFDEKLPALLAQFPQRGKTVNAIYYFDISGDNGGQWTVDLKVDPPAVKPGRTTEPECVIEMSAEDFAAMIRDPQRAIELYFQGKLKVSGDPILATKLQSIFTLG